MRLKVRSSSNNDTENQFPARQQVLETYELLETILSKLPLRKLLLAQGVSKSWKSIIDSSAKLQRALFLKPVDCAHLVDTNDALKIFHDYVKQPHISDNLDLLKWKAREGQFNPNVAFANPLTTALQCFNKTSKIILMRDPEIWRTTRKIKYIPDVGKAGTGPIESWRRMLVSQPPVRIIRLSIRCQCEHCGDWELVVRTASPNKLTLGGMVKLAGLAVEKNKIRTQDRYIEDAFCLEELGPVAGYMIGHLQILTLTLMEEGAFEVLGRTDALEIFARGSARAGEGTGKIPT